MTERSQGNPVNQELIVFVDEHGTPTGEVGPKLESHNADTKLHLAFSCYIFNGEGQLLVTQRAARKKVWPGVWTNSFCGHPLPNEPMEMAIHRRADFELGMRVSGLTCLLPKYVYTTPPYNGIIENEFCPVYAAEASSAVRPNPEEVDTVRWMEWDTYAADLSSNPGAYSYWAKDQLARISAQVLSFLEGV